MIVLNRLIDRGNTVLIIEHNRDVIKCAEHISELGPEGGDKGGDGIAYQKGNNTRTYDFF